VQSQRLASVVLGLPGHAGIRRTIEAVIRSRIHLRVEVEAEIEPDRVLDDLRREAMAAVAERSHADILPDTSLAPDRFP
jgi:hypothetical protein